jgi:phosphoribosyl 1,2-cyclic phosphodiesterase
MRVTFWGARGSTPCPSDANRRYGGNTACVSVEADGQTPIVLDLGTGLRYWGETQPHDGSFRGAAFLTHIHWDHVCGLPFFVPALKAGARLDVYGPTCQGVGLGEAFDGFMRPPYFPVRYTDLHGVIRFHDFDDGVVRVGDVTVTARSVPHTGPTNGYRLERDGRTLAYVSDHQSPSTGGPDEGELVDEAVLELCDGVDVLVHDAQYWPGEWTAKRDWGHCTVDYAVRVASEAGVRRLVLFHHDPAHGDDEVDRMLDHARRLAGGRVGEIVAAAEGMSFDLGRR